MSALRRGFGVRSSMILVTFAGTLAAGTALALCPEKEDSPEAAVAKAAAPESGCCGGSAQAKAAGKPLVGEIRPLSGLFATATEPDDAATTTRSESVMVVSENGQKFEVRVRNGAVGSVKINDEEVPSSRVTLDGGKLTIKDADGSVIKEMQVPGAMGLKMTRDGSHTQTLTTRIMPRGQGMGRAGAHGIVQGKLMEMPEANTSHANVMIGVRLEPVDGILAKHLGLEDGAAVMVAGVAKGLPAAAAGLEPYDVITSVNGKAVASTAELVDMLTTANTNPGDTLNVEYYHHGAKRTATIKTVANDAEKLGGAEWNLAETPELKLGMGGMGGMGGGGAHTFMIPGGPGQQNFIERFNIPEGGGGEGAANLPEVHALIEQAMKQAMQEHHRAGGGGQNDNQLAPKPGDGQGRAQREKQQEQMKEMQQQLKALQEQVEQMKHGKN
ncbi:hypothetical protein BH11PLA1_BH11PLA1_13210 [soil metagenome]